MYQPRSITPQRVPIRAKPDQHQNASMQKSWQKYTGKENSLNSHNGYYVGNINKAVNSNSLALIYPNHLRNLCSFLLRLMVLRRKNA